MKKSTIISLLVALIFFSLGYLVGGVSISSSRSSNTYETGWAAAKKRLADTGFYPVMNNFEVRSISGEVKKIASNSLTIKIRALEPLADANLDERTIVVGADTKIYQLEQKDQATYQKEIEEFNKKAQEQAKNAVPGQAGESITPPEFFAKKTVALTDIKAGQQLTAVAADDIKNTKEIKALEISLQFIPGNLPAATNPASAAPVKN